MKDALARLFLERAHNSLARGEHAEGMLWLARGLENAPAEPHDLPRIDPDKPGRLAFEAKLLERSVRHCGEVHAVAFCPEGRRLATACEDRTARLWDVATGLIPLSPLAARRDPSSRRLPARRDFLATAGDDGLIRRWDAVTGEPDRRAHPPRGPVVALDFSPDGSRIAAVGGSGGFSLWDAATGEPVHRAGRARRPGLAIAFSPDGGSIAVGSDDGRVQLLESSTGKAAGAAPDHGSAITSLAFDPEGRRLLTGSLDGEFEALGRLFTVSTLTTSDQGGVLCVGFRPVGDAFATASDDGTARLWDSATGRPIGEPLAHRKRVDRLAFRPDGTMLATGSPDGMVRLWCASTGLSIGPPLEQGGSGRLLIFSHDGRRLATGGPQSTARCWEVPTPSKGRWSGSPAGSESPPTSTSTRATRSIGSKARQAGTSADA